MVLLWKSPGIDVHNFVCVLSLIEKRASLKTGSFLLTGEKEPSNSTAYNVRGFEGLGATENT
jgi:hypothetical protein